MPLSYWMQSAPSSVIETHLAIVGGGVAGLSSAIEAARLGVDAIVIERQFVGAGASKRNAGFLMRGAADNYGAAVRDYGRRVARDLWRFTEDNLAALRALGIGDVQGYEPRPSCLLALEDGEAEALGASARLLSEDGFKVELIESHDDTAWRNLRPRIGLINPDDGVCHPGRVIDWLRSRVSCSILEQAEVCRIEPVSDGVVVRTQSAEVRAQRVLLCVNAFLSQIVPGGSGLVTPNRGQMLAVDAGPARLDCAYYANHGHEYFRMAEPGVIVVGGMRRADEAGERTRDDTPGGVVQERLEDFTRSLLGSTPRIITRWAGTMGFSADGLPVIGPLDDPLAGLDPEGRVWFCGGFTGHGMSMGHLASTLATRAILGRGEAPGWLSIERTRRGGAGG